MLIFHFLCLYIRKLEYSVMDGCGFALGTLCNSHLFWKNQIVPLLNLKILMQISVVLMIKLIAVGLIY